MKYSVLIALVAAKHHHHHQRVHSLSQIQGVDVPQPLGWADKTFVPGKAEAEQVTSA